MCYDICCQKVTYNDEFDLAKALVDKSMKAMYC